MIVLDLFCGAGGASYGYHLAGFDVVGVDRKPQPNYPFEFHQADALTYPLEGFDIIHASPPCQHYTQRTTTRPYFDLIPLTRERIEAYPYVIENVPGAPLHNPITLCGTSFPPLEVRRHRIFESNMTLIGKPCNHERLSKPKYPGSTNRSNLRTVCDIGSGKTPLAVQKGAIGIHWMHSHRELSQAIPPQYTEYIGTQLRTLFCDRV